MGLFGRYIKQCKNIIKACIDVAFGLGGPLGGSTTVTVNTSLVRSLGDVRCRFGLRNRESDGTVASPSLVRCASPAHWNSRSGTQREPVEVTFNGQDYTTSGSSVYTVHCDPSTATGLVRLLVRCWIR